MNDHPLNQAFVLEALRRYAYSVSTNKATLNEQMKTSMISGEAWVASADAWIGIDPITVVPLRWIAIDPVLRRNK